ncbi:MAG TPA: C45 family peptidase [Jatrophihabitans sp.]|jgi:isopenicillin-N N-acyltransferase-like protein|uniref:C45 family autoproteolytic acyltransferase/hydolase n=1 Tax=Jatrophihabitans sp. TaxID=1932789 RepID=UPI002F127714
MRTLRIAGAEPEQRAAELATGSARWLPDALAGYDQLFAATGLRPERIRRLGLAARDALAGWAPDLSAELDCLAGASGVPEWRIHAVNARTELLAAAGAASRGECSTVAGENPAGAMIGAQTWDWHQELAGGWAVLEYPRASRPFVTLTEFGLLGKIGINSAGLGVLFNILSHRADTGDGGVPVHAVARRILDSAGDVEAGIAILRSAPLAASSCFTLLDATRLACLEASPAGVAELPPARWSVHTNHFQDPGLAAGALPIGDESDSLPRHAVLTALTAGPAGDPDARSAEELADLLCAHEADGAGVCCHAAADAPLGSGWQTLATVGLDPADRRMSVLAGGPCGRPEQRWRQFRAG